MASRRRSGWSRDTPARRRGGRVAEPADEDQDRGEDPRHPRPVEAEGGWHVPPPLGSRLWQKSALGRPYTGGGVLLSAAEVAFCHAHRHLPWPEEGWWSAQAAADGDLVVESAALAHLRRPGELVGLVEHHQGTPAAAGTWAYRWHREQHPAKDPPAAQVRWVRATDAADLDALDAWTTAVEAAEQSAEVLVVDDELDVTWYRCTRPQPVGRHGAPAAAEPSVLDLLRATLTSDRHDDGSSPDTGRWVAWPDDAAWPWPRIGLPRAGGRWLDPLEQAWVERRLRPDAVGDLSATEALHAALLDRGLLPRSGFKFGTRWRVYEQAADEEHAPWLIVPWQDGPATWQDICLAARLASGVRKRWLVADGALERRWSIQRVSVG